MRTAGRDFEREATNGLDHAIAAIIANTRRVRRTLDLIALADWIDVVRNHLGSLRSVGETVGLSEQQLRDFMTVRDLTSAVERLVRQRKIDSVDVVKQLAKLVPREQLSVAQAFIARDITSKDVRQVTSLRSRTPDAPIEHVLGRVVRSRNIKEYIVEFSLRGVRSSPATIRRRFESLVGARNIRSFSIRGRVGRAALTAEGRRRLQQAAKRRRLTKRELVDHIVPRGG